MVLDKFNPCKTQNALQKAIEFLTYGTECRCCIGARIVFAFLIGFTLGYVI